MSDNSRRSTRSEKLGLASSKVIEIGSTGEAILQQVEQLDRLINVTASTSSFQAAGHPRKLSTLQGRASMVQRRPSALAGLRTIFDSSTPSSPTPDEVMRLDSSQYSANETTGTPSPTPDRPHSDSRTASHKASRKVHPHGDTNSHVSEEGISHASEQGSEMRSTPSEAVVAELPTRPTLGRKRSSMASFAEGSGSGRKSSAVSLGEGSFGLRRGSYSSFAENVVSIAQSLTKVFDKSSNNEMEEKRQAKIAELVDKEVMVLNAAQLAQIQQRSAHPFTISINSPFHRWWDLIITLTTTYVMIFVPIKVGFSAHPTGVGFVLDVLVDIIFLLETTLNFFTSYEDDTTGEEVKEIVKIRQNYLYGWFAIDAISSFPSSLAGTRHVGLNLTKVVKISQVYKMSNSGLFKATSARINRSMNPSMLRMMMLTLVFFVSQHFIACTYFYISNNQDERTSWGPTDEIRASSLGKKYIDAFYFAIMVTTANDVNPTTYIEKLFTAFMLFVGIVINASIIGSAANLLSNLDKAEIARKNQMDSINEYLRFKKVPLVLQDKIRRYYDYALNGRIRDPTETLFVDLPDRMKLALKLNLHEEFIRKVPLFRVCSNAGVVAIIQCLKLVVAMPGEIIVRQGEVANEFYFIKSGRVSISVQSLTFETIPLGNLGEGSFFGEISLLTGEPQSAEVRAESIAELAYLTQSDFTAITEKFPTFFLAVKRISESRMQTANNVRKISRHSRHQVPSPLRKGSLRRSGMLMSRSLKGMSTDSKSSTGVVAMARAHTVKSISKRLSNSRRKTPESFNALYVERLSLAQARQLSQIRAISDIVIDNPDEDPTWDD